MSRTFFIISVLAIIAIFTCGCASGAGRGGALNSFVAGGAPENALTLVAHDLSETLSESYPPGHTLIFLKQTGGQSDALAPALEESLRSRGFRLASEAQGNALTVAYVFDRIGEEGWYSRLSTSSGLMVARSYQQNGERLEASGAASLEKAGK